MLCDLHPQGWTGVLGHWGPWRWDRLGQESSGTGILRDEGCVGQDLLGGGSLGTGMLGAGDRGSGRGGWSSFALRSLLSLAAARRAGSRGSPGPGEAGPGRVPSPGSQVTPGGGGDSRRRRGGTRDPVPTSAPGCSLRPSSTARRRPALCPAGPPGPEAAAGRDREGGAGGRAGAAPPLPKPEISTVRTETRVPYPAKTGFSFSVRPGFPPRQPPPAPTQG